MRVKKHVQNAKISTHKDMVLRVGANGINAIWVQNTNDTSGFLPTKLKCETWATFQFTPTNPLQAFIEFQASEAFRKGFELQHIVVTDLDNDTEVTDEDKIGFAGLFDAFLNWNYKHETSFHKYLVSTFNANKTLSPDLYDLLFVPLEWYQSQCPFDTLKQSAIDKLKKKIKKEKTEDFTFPEMVALNAEPLCDYFDVLKPLLTPEEANRLTTPRTNITVPPIWDKHRGIRGAPVKLQPGQDPTTFNPRDDSPNLTSFEINHINPIINGSPILFCKILKEELRAFLIQLAYTENQNQYSITSSNKGFGITSNPSLLENLESIYINNKPLTKFREELAKQKRVSLPVVQAAPDDGQVLLENILINRCFQENEFPNNSNAAKIQIEYLKTIYKQDAADLPLRLISNMIAEMQLDWTSTKTNPKTTLKYHQKVLRNMHAYWEMINSASVVIYYKQGDETFFIANITYELKSIVRIPEYPQFFYSETLALDRIKNTAKSDGFKPTELTFTGQKAIIPCLKAYFDKLTNPAVDKNKTFVQLASTMIAFYNQYGCVQRPDNTPPPSPQTSFVELED